MHKGSHTWADDPLEFQAPDDIAWFEEGVHPHDEGDPDFETWEARNS